MCLSMHQVHLQHANREVTLCRAGHDAGTVVGRQSWEIVGEKEAWASELGSAGRCQAFDSARGRTARCEGDGGYCKA
jgi:hypothetical protein